MSASNFPPGMSRADWDHVEGVARCINCGAVLRELDNGDWPEECPGGCDEPDHDSIRDAREGF